MNICRFWLRSYTPCPKLLNIITTFCVLVFFSPPNRYQLEEWFSLSLSHSCFLLGLFSSSSFSCCILSPVFINPWKSPEHGEALKLWGWRRPGDEQPGLPCRPLSPGDQQVRRPLWSRTHCGTPGFGQKCPGFQPSRSKQSRGGLSGVMVQSLGVQIPSLAQGDPLFFQFSSECQREGLQHARGCSGSSLA